MAIIQCPKCNQSISDQAVKCIHCGEVVLQNTCKECGNKYPADMTECPNCGFPASAKAEKEPITEKITSTVKKHKKIVIIGSVVLSIVILLSFVIGIAGSVLTPDEQFAYDIVASLRNSMVDRDAFTLYDNIYIFRHYNENGENDYTYTVFEYASANGYGGIESEIAIYKDYEKKLNYSSLENWCNKTPNSLADAYYQQSCILLKFDIDTCLDGNGSILGYETIIVDARKIENKLEQDK